ncbi:MAG: hypothetical protein HY535_01445 [Chloroflexi bacterium]|nr:hypothetical protein [Chloroflexota bacterium]
MKRQQLLALAAVPLFLASLAFPFWTARMKAPTYPEKALAMELYAYKYDGDLEEWNRVGRAVGVRVPPPVPDVFFPLFTAAVVGMGALALAGALRERWLGVAAVCPWLVLGVLMAWGQYSLYLFGHSLDPERPLRYLEPFTPPIVGVLTLGKIQTYHFPYVGSLLFVAAAALVVASAWQAGRLRLAWPRTRREAPVSAD